MAAERVILGTSLLVAASIEPHPGHEAARSYLDRYDEEISVEVVAP
jgi:predicted nucleic acid-binding protein